LTTSVLNRKSVRREKCPSNLSEGERELQKKKREEILFVGRIPEKGESVCLIRSLRRRVKKKKGGGDDIATTRPPPPPKNPEKGKRDIFTVYGGRRGMVSLPVGGKEKSVSLFQRHGRGKRGFHAFGGLRGKALYRFRYGERKKKFHYSHLRRKEKKFPVPITVCGLE